MGMNKKGPIERFMEKIEKHNSGCWLWKAGKGTTGYGRILFKGKVWQAHRFSYENFVGPIESGKYILHKCDVRNCVNPDHLYSGDQFDNMRDCSRRGRQKNGNNKKTHCPKGHPYLGENLIIVKTTGHRRCKACDRERQRKSYNLRRNKGENYQPHY